MLLEKYNFDGKNTDVILAVQTMCCMLWPELRNLLQIG